MMIRIRLFAFFAFAGITAFVIQCVNSHLLERPPETLVYVLLSLFVGTATTVSLSALGSATAGRLGALVGCATAIAGWHIFLWVVGVPDGHIDSAILSANLSFTLAVGATTMSIILSNRPTKEPSGPWDRHSVTHLKAIQDSDQHNRRRGRRPSGSHDE